MTNPKTQTMFKALTISAILLFNISNASGQTYILLHRAWDDVPIFTDTITKEHLNKGYQPIYKAELDSLIALISQFKNLNDAGIHYDNTDLYSCKQKQAKTNFENKASQKGFLYDAN